MASFYNTDEKPYNDQLSRGTDHRIPSTAHSPFHSEQRGIP